MLQQLKAGGGFSCRQFGADCLNSPYGATLALLLLLLLLLPGFVGGSPVELLKQVRRQVARVPGFHRCLQVIRRFLEANPFDPGGAPFPEPGEVVREAGL